MLNKIKQYTFVGLVALMGLSTNAQGYDCVYNGYDRAAYDCDTCCPKFYFGVFGGGGNSCNTDTNQQGTAFFPPIQGGPLVVDARGSLKSGTAAIGGAHIGIEFPCVNMPGCCDWGLVPAFELEGLYLKRLGNNQTGLLTDSTNRLLEHDFLDTLPIQCGAILVNALLAYESCNCSWFQPYIGAGIGGANLWVCGANSLQTNPLEPGVNHFNSDRSASEWVIAVQAKVGLRFILGCNWRLFAEYRFFHLNPPSLTFGDTRYPGHVPTTRWRVNMDCLSHNLGVIGIQYVL